MGAVERDPDAVKAFLRYWKKLNFTVCRAFLGTELGYSYQILLPDGTFLVPVGNKVRLTIPRELNVYIHGWISYANEADAYRDIQMRLFDAIVTDTVVGVHMGWSVPDVWTQAINDLDMEGL